MDSFNWITEITIELNLPEPLCSRPHFRILRSFKLKKFNNIQNLKVWSSSLAISQSVRLLGTQPTFIAIAASPCICQIQLLDGCNMTRLHKHRWWQQYQRQCGCVCSILHYIWTVFFWAVARRTSPENDL